MNIEKLTDIRFLAHVAAMLAPTKNDFAALGHESTTLEWSIVFDENVAHMTAQWIYNSYGNYSGNRCLDYNPISIYFADDIETLPQVKAALASKADVVVAEYVSGAAKAMLNRPCYVVNEYDDELEVWGTELSSKSHAEVIVEDVLAPNYEKLDCLEKDGDVLLRYYSTNAAGSVVTEYVHYPMPPELQTAINAKKISRLLSRLEDAKGMNDRFQKAVYVFNLHDDRPTVLALKEAELLPDHAELQELAALLAEVA